MRTANDYNGYSIVILYPLKSLGTLETQKTTGIPVNIVWEGIRLQLWQRGIIHIYEFKPLTLSVPLFTLRTGHGRYGSGPAR